MRSAICAAWTVETSEGMRTSGSPPAVIVRVPPETLEVDSGAAQAKSNRAQRSRTCFIVAKSIPRRESAVDVARLPRGFRPHQAQWLRHPRAIERRRTSRSQLLPCPARDLEEPRVWQVVRSS